MASFISSDHVHSIEISGQETWRWLNVFSDYKLFLKPDTSNESQRRAVMRSADQAWSLSIVHARKVCEDDAVVQARYSRSKQMSRFFRTAP